MKKLLVASLIVVLAMSVLIGCTPAVDKNKDMVIMVTDMGGVDDKSFNESAWEGLQQFAEANNKYKVDFVESSSENDYAGNLAAAVAKGSDLTWAIGYMMASQLQDAAANNPNTSFAIIDWAPEDMADAKDNVAYVTFAEHEGSFLVGLIAGLTTESNKVGFVGGMSGGLIKKFETGFHAGVKAVNPEAEVFIQYAEDWGDTVKGEQIATNMIRRGADVVYHAAGGTGVGVAKAAADNKVWFIGVDKDQSELTPEYTLTSMLKRVDSAVANISALWAEGKFPGKTVTSMTLADEGVGYVYDENKINAEIKAVVDEWEAKIRSGEVTIPSNDEEFTTFIASLNE